LGRYFKDTLIHKIDLQELMTFKTHRINNDGVGGPTVQRDFVALNQVLSYCKSQKIIKKLKQRLSKWL